MTRVAFLAGLMAAAMFGGCTDKAKLTAVENRCVNSKQADGLQLQLCLDRRDLVTGETIAVTVTATNMTNAPIRIDSPSGAPVIVRIIRHTSLYSDEVKYYPQSATANILSWVLPAGGSRPFTLMVPVEPDWPVEEVLHLTAELNGYPKVAPSLAVTVRRK